MSQGQVPVYTSLVYCWPNRKPNHHVTDVSNTIDCDFFSTCGKTSHRSVVEHAGRKAEGDNISPISPTLSIILYIPAPVAQCDCFQPKNGLYSNYRCQFENFYWIFLKINSLSLKLTKLEVFSLTTSTVLEIWWRSRASINNSTNILMKIKRKFRPFFQAKTQ